MSENVEQIINSLVQTAMSELEAGNVYVGEFGEEIIRKAVVAASEIKTNDGI